MARERGRHLISLDPNVRPNVIPDGARQVDGVLVKVVDTIGAGDAFMSGLLARLFELGLLDRGRLESLSDDLTDVLQFAVRVSALTCTRAGAEPPTKSEVSAWT